MTASMRLRSVFLAGCVGLALPGFAACGFSAVQAWAAWRAAGAAALGTRAAGQVLRAIPPLMGERGRVQEASLTADPQAVAALRPAEAASDLALQQARSAVEVAGLPIAAIERARDGLVAARERAASAISGKRSALRTPVEQYNRLAEGLEEEVSRIERTVTLANPSVGLAVGLAHNAAELRSIAGRRGVLLNIWLGGSDLQPLQKDELLALNGRLAGAWERLQRGVRSSGLGSALSKTVAATEAEFFLEQEPWYRELVKAAASGAERPMDFRRFRPWHVSALERLLPLREALLSEAAAQAAAATDAARIGLFAAAGGAMLSLFVVALSVLALLRGLVEPVRGMTEAMTALASGDLSAAVPAGSRLREIGAMVAAVSVFRDNVANLHRRDAELQETNLRFAAALENMSQGLCMYGPDERLVVFNGRFCEVTGLPAEQVKPGMPFQEVVALAASAGLFKGKNTEQAYAERRGHVSQLAIGGQHHDELTSCGRVLAVYYKPMANGGWVATYEDVTQRRRSEEQLSYLARHDALTGLPNRILLREHLEAVLHRLRRGPGTASVLCLDLDGFKNVNDTLGHPAGDELLCQVAARLRETTRATDLVARLGGDEFAVVQADAEQPTNAAVFAERLVGALREPFILAGHRRVEIGTSIGVILANEASTADELLRSADIALYRAKAAGRGTWRFFEQSMDEEMQARRVLELDLKHALANGQFELYYQPLVEASTGALTGFEALLRWNHPERGMVSPADFVPLTEETGLIRLIGEWVLRKACTDASCWPEHVKVAVNLSPVQFAKGDLVGEVERALSTSGLAPSRLELEITESVLLADSEATLVTLHRLRSLGVCISMDDFGTGYSSLSYLRRFPFDKIKIDQSFVRNLDCEKGSVEIVRAVVGLGKALNMNVLAEGVETDGQLAILQLEGCDELQGYLFSKPRPARDLSAIIAGHAHGKDEGLLHSPMLVVDNTGNNQAPAYEQARNVARAQR